MHVQLLVKEYSVIFKLLRPTEPPKLISHQIIPLYDMIMLILHVVNLYFASKMIKRIDVVNTQEPEQHNAFDDALPLNLSRLLPTRYSIEMKVNH